MAHRLLDHDPSALDPSPGTASPGAAWRLWRERLIEELLAERERWFLWLPVGLGIGIALYFALPSEPPLWLGPALLASLALVAATILRAPAGLGPPLAVVLALLVVLAGLSAAQLRTARVEAPVLERRGAYWLEGEVGLVEARVRGRRVVLQRPAIDDLAPESTPALVRVSLRGPEPELRPGDRVRLRAMLMPPSPPAAPGDFDFARQAFFLGLGAVGYSLGAPEVVRTADRWSPALALAALRQRIAGAIHAAIPGDAGAVGSALLTGLRGAIPDHIWRAMQIAGIAHLLAISGLHLGLVAGTLFFAARIGIALVPPLALRLPGKKVAAGIAMAGAFAYLLLTGATVPTQRAFIMTALMLLAVMVDRNPFSMRLVALAAVVVLLGQPESLLGASFQMSFAAVIALIAVYESGLGQQRPERASGLDRRFALYVGGVALTTLVASLATAPFALQHFNRVATYGIATNLIAVPLTAFWIMPLGLLGLLLLPIGLGHLCFVLMGRGIELVLVVAQTVADWPGAALTIATPPPAALIVTALGALWLCLWRRRWRLAGLAGPLLALPIALLHDPPDVLIDQRGRLAAVRLDDGGVALAPWDKDNWVYGQWLRRFGTEQAAPWPEPGLLTEHGLRCDALGCVLTRGGVVLALARRPEAIEEDCARAGMVLSDPRVEACPSGDAQLIGPRALRRAGGLALWLEDGEARVQTTRQARGDRPWAQD